MIWNIIDRRKRPYRWKCVNAIIEDTWHDNSVSDSDEAPEDLSGAGVIYDQRASITLTEAIRWANEQVSPVTLYIYDEGAGFNVGRIS